MTMTQPTNKKTFYMDVLMVVACSLIFAWSINIFIVPIGLYNSGVIGIAQVLRSVLTRYAGLQVSFDLAGIFNVLLNIPLFILAYKSMSKRFFTLTLLSVMVQSIAVSLIPIPTTPILDDVLASCIIGGIISGAAIGLLFVQRASGGGTDIISIYIAQKSSKIGVGTFQTLINIGIYSACALLFDLQSAIYSILYAAIFGFVIDRIHLQNIEMNVMIFTRNSEIKNTILKDYVRGVTYWQGTGAYTGNATEVLVTIVSKAEVEPLKKSILAMDPHAFIIVNEGSKVTGGFEKRLY